MLVFSYQSVLTYVLSAQKNRLIGSIEYPQHMFWLRSKQAIFSSPTLKDLNFHSIIVVVPVPRGYARQIKG